MPSSVVAREATPEEQEEFWRLWERLQKARLAELTAHEAVRDFMAVHWEDFKPRNTDFAAQMATFNQAYAKVIKTDAGREWLARFTALQEAQKPWEDFCLQHEGVCFWASRPSEVPDAE